MTRLLRFFLGIATLSIFFGCNLKADASFLSPHQLSRSAPATAVIHQDASTRRKNLIVVKQTREDEIRRKIAQLKQDGKIKNRPSQQDDDGKRSMSVAEQYGDRLKQKLGSRKAKLMGATIIGNKNEIEDELIAELDGDDGEEVDVKQRGRQAQLGALNRQEESEENTSNYVPPSASKTVYKNFDASLFEDDEDDDEEELSEEELVELVAAKMAEKRIREKEEQEAKMREAARKKLDELKNEQQQLKQEEREMLAGAEGKTTTGIGGSWSKNNETASADYKPSKSGTWGVFERPKDISRAYGGGKRVGAGYTPDNLNKKKSEEETRARLQQYREKVGIDVQSEKDHADEIEQARAIGRRAMERGIYSTAVSALEKVTQWCSSNSPIGGNVYLELAMAYEAVGRTQEAVKVYTVLTRSRMEEVKYNAKRLLYGIEAMEFMKNEAKSPEFSRKKIKSTFIETTGLDNFASNFDDVYNTAYIDLDRGYYRQLTESVVRSNREARQILLKATGAGEVQRLKIVQALRSLSRNFDDALEEEMKSSQPAPEPVAFMDGKPIMVEPTREQRDQIKKVMASIDEFSLGTPEQMLENMNGEWRLQLLADKRGDGVKYYNTTFSWQKLDTKSMTFTSSGASGFLTVDQSGGMTFQDERRILKRTDLEVSGTGGLLSGFLAKGTGGAPGAISAPHQVVAVDSVLMITRMAPTKKKPTYDDSTKEYFAVWRRVQQDTSGLDLDSLEESLDSPSP